MSDLLQTLRDLENEAIEELALVEERVAQRVNAPLQHLVGKRVQAKQGPCRPAACCEVLGASFEADPDHYVTNSYVAWLEVLFDGQKYPTGIPLGDVVEVL
jgi:hypothetical protein